MQLTARHPVRKKIFKCKFVLAKLIGRVVKSFNKKSAGVAEAIK